MKVDHSRQSPVQNADTSAARGAKGAQENKHLDKAEGRSHVHRESDAKPEISAKAHEFAAAKAAASAAPDVREDRVADLKRRIASGNYNVDADAIADRMVDEHLSMSGA
ncbi:MAG: flagellar biosynthesis anti-sigma factor FlgM [Bdellovibrionota bacterium]